MNVTTKSVRLLPNQPVHISARLVPRKTISAISNSVQLATYFFRTA